MLRRAPKAPEWRRQRQTKARLDVIDPPLARRDALVEAIRVQLGADAGEVRKQLELFREVDSKLASIGNAKAISRGAKEFRAKFRGFRAKGQQDSFADLLQATLPRSFEVIDRELEWLTRIVGPDPRFDRTKWLSAECARILVGIRLIFNDGELIYVTRAGEPAMAADLCGIVHLVYEYLGGEPDQSLARACRAVLRPSPR
jgi:hypothetical protein